MDVLASSASFCISVVLLAVMAQRVLVNMLLLSTKPPHIETPRAATVGGAQEMPLLSMEAHSAPRADSRGEQTLAPEPSGTEPTDIPLLTSRETSAMEISDPLQSALVASALDMPVQALPSSPEVAMGLSGRRLFLDICAGATRPRSQAALQAGMHVLSVDPFQRFALRAAFEIEFLGSGLVCVR